MLLIQKTTDGDKISAKIILKYIVFVNHIIVLFTVLGSHVSEVTSWVLIGIDFCLNILICIKLVWIKKRNPGNTMQQIDHLQNLAMCELVEFQAPLTFFLTFIAAYYGPNAKLFGNVSNSYWTNIAVENISLKVQQMTLCFLADFSSMIVSGAVLWKYCKINIFKIILHLQQEFGLAFCIILGAQFDAVSLYFCFKRAVFMKSN